MPQFKKYLMFIVIFAISLSATIFSAFALHKGNNDVLASKLVVTTKIKSVKRQKEVEKNVVQTYIPKTQVNEFKKLIGNKSNNINKKVKLQREVNVVKNIVKVTTKKCDDETIITKYDENHNTFVTNDGKQFRLFGVNLNDSNSNLDDNKTKLITYITKNIIGKKISIVYPKLIRKEDNKDYSYTDDTTGKFVSVFSWFVFIDGKNIAELLSNENLVTINESEISNTNDEFVNGLKSKLVDKKDIEIKNDVKFKIQDNKQDTESTTNIDTKQKATDKDGDDKKVLGVDTEVKN